jgi:hypothetical protein
MSSIFDAKWNNVADKIRLLKASNQDRLPLDTTVQLLDDCFSRVSSVPSTQQLDAVAQELKGSPLLSYFQNKLADKANRVRIGPFPNVFSKYLNSSAWGSLIEKVSLRTSLGDEEVTKLIRMLENPRIDVRLKQHNLENILTNHVASMDQLMDIMNITRKTNPYLTTIFAETLHNLPQNQLNAQLAREFLESKEWKQTASAILTSKAGGQAGQAWHIMEQAKNIRDPIYGDVFMENPQFIKNMDLASRYYKISKQNNPIKQVVGWFDDKGKYWRSWRDLAEGPLATLRRICIP